MNKFTAESRFDCDFDELARGKVCALTPVISKNGIGLGLAVANERGYHPIPEYYCNADKWDDMADHADKLNKELFNLDIEQAGNIVMSSMRQGNH